MIAHLKSLLRKFDEKNTETDSIDFKTGLAALLVEVMRADGHTDQQELDSIEQTLITYCDLDIPATSQL